MKHVITILLVIIYYKFISSDIESILGVGVFYILIPLIIIPVLSYGAFEDRKSKKILKAFKSKLESDGLKITHELPSIYLDAKSRKFVIYKIAAMNDEIEHRIIDFKDILGTSIVKDGQQITSTSTGSLVGRALVGGVILGGFGAILGGLTAKSKSENRIKKLVLEIIINQPDYPIHRITYLNSSGTSPDSIKVRTAVEKIEFAHAIIELAIMGEDIPAARSTQELQDTLRMHQLLAKRAEV